MDMCSADLMVHREAAKISCDGLVTRRFGESWRKERVEWIFRVSFSEHDPPIFVSVAMGLKRN